MSWIDVAVGPDNTAHLAVQDSYTDGDGYAEISHWAFADGGSAFTDGAVIADGWYDGSCRRGNYFANPSIAIDPSGYWHIALQVKNWGGQASWSAESIGLWTNDPAGAGSGPGD